MCQMEPFWSQNWPMGQGLWDRARGQGPWARAHMGGPMAPPKWASGARPKPPKSFRNIDFLKKKMSGFETIRNLWSIFVIFNTLWGKNTSGKIT